jgi:RNA polymerase sigma-54 factor
MQQAIRLLALTRAEFLQTIETELMENPALESNDDAERPWVEDPWRDTASCPNTGATAQDRALSVLDRMLTPEWQQYLDNHANDRHDTRAFESLPSDDAPEPWESRVTKKPTLEEHLIWQLRMSKIGPGEARIGILIIGNLDERGYLAVALEEICSLAQATRAEVEAVLKRVQRFDPIGVAARDLAECLLIQLGCSGLADGLAARMVSHCLAHLESRRYEKIARDLGVSIEQVLEAMRVIGSLEPKPSRGYDAEEAWFVTPDVFVERSGDEIVVRVNDTDLPRLRVSSSYSRTIGPGGETDESLRQYLKDKIRAAKWFIESVEQRQKTLRKVTQSIFKFQREFLERGAGYLKPLVLREVARDISMHESTVSRATSNKWVSTPHGVFQFKRFFQHAIPGPDGDLASERVKELIRRVITGEDAQKPHSDEEIVTLLAQQSVHMARRTVAKYRESMGILPSWNRRAAPAHGKGASRTGFRS